MPVDVHRVPLDFSLQGDAKIPSLRSLVTVGNTFQDDIAMNDEFYCLELELAAQESSIEKGNIFLTATVQGADKAIVYHRMGHMRARNPLMLAAKHTLWYMPLGSWLISTT